MLKCVFRECLKRGARCQGVLSEDVLYKTNVCDFLLFVHLGCEIGRVIVINEKPRAFVSLHILQQGPDSWEKVM